MRDNGEALLEALLWYGPQAKAELAAHLGLGRAALAGALDDLLASGWVAPLGEASSTGGRRAMTVGLNSAFGCVLGITLEDREGTVTLADSALEVLGSTRCAYSLEEGPAKVMARVTETARRVLSEQHDAAKKLLAVGVSILGPVERSSGLLIHPPAMPAWEGFSLHEHLGQLGDAPVYIDNDANLFALGELWGARRADAAAKLEHWLIVKLSDWGIGAGLIVGGTLYRGAGGGAGEVGHVRVLAGGPLCTCGLRGCLQALAAAPAVLRRATEMARDGSSEALRTLLGNRRQLTLTDLTRASFGGDEATNTLLLEAGRHIGGVLAGLVNVLNPAKVLIGGTYARVSPVMLAAIRQGVYGCSLPLMSRRVVVDYMRSDTGTAGPLVHALRETWTGS